MEFAGRGSVMSKPLSKVHQLGKSFECFQCSAGDVGLIVSECGENLRLYCDSCFEALLETCREKGYTLPEVVGKTEEFFRHKVSTHEFVRSVLLAEIDRIKILCDQLWRRHSDNKNSTDEMGRLVSEMAFKKYQACKSISEVFSIYVAEMDLTISARQVLEALDV